MTPEWVKNAKVGDKVVCIDGTPKFYIAGANILKTNEVCTIRFIGLWKGDLDRVVIQTEEHINTHLNEYYEPAFNAANFKPLEKRKTDISVFTSMLKKHHKEKKEPVGA